MTDNLEPDVLIIGGGPGGYVAAIRAAQLGLSTVCVERDATLGGTCVNVGCIPSKALLESSHHYEFARDRASAHGVMVGDVKLDLGVMQKRKTNVVAQNTRGIEFLFRKNGIAWAKGSATLLAGNVVEVRGAPPETNLVTYKPKSVIIATGSVPVALPFLPFDEDRVLSNTGALALPDVPERLIVIGGGVIGVELGSVWRRLGSKVTIIELLPSILAGYDAELAREAEKTFRKQGLEIRTGTKVTGARREGDRMLVDVEKDGAKETLEADRVLVSVGRKPSLSGIDANALGLALGPRGEIAVDDQMRTNLPGVYAIGDAVGGLLLAHKAEDEGIIAVEVIAGQKSHMHYNAIPAIVYTTPEVAAVGLTEEEVKESGRAYKIGSFPYSANARARTAGDATGFVKLIADAETDQLLGAHIIGPSASELLAELTLTLEFGGSSEDIALTVHPHPTLSETTREAALAVLGRAIHF
ncbi:MAG: dihydrolipoyl dehydrogenase [Gemmatimonadaceae bacterium]|nr:dihydrolipoyl dehydrogenase [Gemmatimonadaceae bacterium]